MMTILRNPRILAALTCTLLLSNILVAEVLIDQPQEEHVTVGSRPMDPEKCEKIQAQKLQRAYESEDPQIPSSSTMQFSINKAMYQPEGQSFQLASAKMMQAPLVLASFPLSCHWLTSKSADFRQIRIEDGSTWEVSSGDYSVINGWRNDDPLFITPITSWFISQNYYITNRTNNTYVKANLIDGPLTFGPYSHWVTGIDPIQGHVFLENQSVWCVDPKDLYILTDRKNNNEWAQNDHIIIILHDNRYSQYDHILINVNMDNQVHAKQY